MIVAALARPVKQGMVMPLSHEADSGTLHSLWGNDLRRGIHKSGAVPSKKC